MTDLQEGILEIFAAAQYLGDPRKLRWAHELFDKGASIIYRKEFTQRETPEQRRVRYERVMNNLRPIQSNYWKRWRAASKRGELKRIPGRRRAVIDTEQGSAV